MTKFIALDFDGVICNSIDECMLVSFCSYFDLSISQSRLSEIRADYKRHFKNYRYLVGPAHEYFDLWNAIDTSKSEDQIISIFHNNKKNYKSLKRAQQTFYGNRENLKSSNYSYWVKLNPFYNKIFKILLDVDDINKVFIVTSKDYLSVVDLLNSNNLPIKKKNIYSYEKSLDKKVLFKQLLDDHRIKIDDISFFDDKLSHLENVSSFGIKSYLALWGYVSPNCKLEARKKGISTITQIEFIETINDI
tara:strand:+ start:105 stop:848 length:744 start_codon:yes stop_codon:yes gene_type:complete